MAGRVDSNATRFDEAFGDMIDVLNMYESDTSNDEDMVFLDRNLDTSQPSGPRDPAPPLLRRLRPGSTSA
ncbi:uncharacterized protein PAC_07662 [Phialocephala subalpina]|uniref:Uncharacterized protein n=1 Tax=Phialocephala subalpina TaxID=576137 RepID=A0A1L7WYC2_9HELO|nr:uncharacterized protein PAC_07662 [Phialocephala subalpina]